MNNNFSDNIKIIRKEHNLSQEQLAEELGVSRQAISKWESGAAYPEMDKIITICKKYNCNIDDLLHSDIKEVKGEEETKKNINNYIEGFFQFVTDSVNMFIRMKFWSKMKFLFEQFVIALILMIGGKIIYGILTTIMSHSLLGMIPVSIYSRIESFFEAIYILIAFVVAVVVMVRIFKNRYLDYYEEVVEEQKEEKTSRTAKNDNAKITFKEESKIVVRNSKDSDYHLLRGLFKIFLFFVKLAVLQIEIGLCIALVFVGIGLSLSFLVSKTGIFFLGCFFGCLSSGIALAAVIILLFNFVFNRKSNKKLIIWSFVGSILVIGISIGMVMIGSLQFELVDEVKNPKTDEYVIEMNDSLLLRDRENIEYIPEERENIRIEYVVDEHLTTNYTLNNDNVIQLYSYTENEWAYMKNILKDLNNKRIYSNRDYETIRVYASAANLEKLHNNQTAYYDEQQRREEEMNALREELEETKRELEETKIELDAKNQELELETEE